MSDEDNTYPMPSRQDKAISAGKIAAGAVGTVATGLSGIPFLGTAATELFSRVVIPTLDKRRANWSNKLAIRVKVLEEHDRNLFENLKENPLFVSVLTHALQIALRNHEEEKLQALSNAVINTAKPIFSDDTLYLMFLNWIDSIQGLHIRVLRFVFYEKPNSLDQIHTLMDRYKEEHPGDEVRFDLFNQVLKDLSDRDLMKINRLRSSDMGETAVFAHVTNMGKDFLAFVTEGTLK